MNLKSGWVRTMGRKKLAGFGVRRPADSEDAIRRLEERTEARGQGTSLQASERSSAQTSKRPDVQDPSIVQRVGRLKADGSRTEGKTLRRLTVYLDLDVAKDLDRRATEEGVNRSDLIQAAVVAFLD